MATRISFPRDLVTRDTTNDFSDDGTSFRTYLYKNSLAFTYAFVDGERYLDITIPADYTIITDEDRRKANMYNGVKSVDMDTFIKNCEYFYQKYIVTTNKPDVIANVKEINEKINELYQKNRELFTEFSKKQEEIKNKINELIEEERALYNRA